MRAIGSSLHDPSASMQAHCAIEILLMRDIFYRARAMFYKTHVDNHAHFTMVTPIGVVG